MARAAAGNRLVSFTRVFSAEEVRHADLFIPMTGGNPCTYILRVVNTRSEEEMPSPQDFGLTKAAYTVRETEALLSVSHTTIYELIKGGRLKSVKLRTKTLILSTEIAGFLTSLRG